MNYSIMKQWKTLAGEYHSTTVDKSDWDTAFGEIHSMVKPMQNDPNVAMFVLTLLDEDGNRKEKIEWHRKVEEPETEPIEE